MQQLPMNVSDERFFFLSGPPKQIEVKSGYGKPCRFNFFIYLSIFSTERIFYSKTHIKIHKITFPEKLKQLALKPDQSLFSFSIPFLS